MDWNLEVKASLSFFQSDSLHESPEAGTSRKRPNIISHRGRKFRRKSVSAPDATGSESSDSSGPGPKEKASSDFGPKFSGDAKSGSIRCRFCGKEYQHLKARNKHLVSDHFEECKKVKLVLTWPRLRPRLLVKVV